MIEIFVFANIMYFSFELISYAISKTSIFQLKSRLFSDTFTLLSLISVYSVIKTGGKTILAFNILLGIYLLILSKNNSQKVSQTINSLKIKKRVLYGALTFNFLFFIHYFHIYDISLGQFKLINEDYYFYSRMSGYLRDFGVENIAVEYFLEDKGGLSPYHYFELWFGAMTSELTNTNSFLSLKLIVFPIIQTLSVLGLFELLRNEFKQYFNQNVVLFVLAFLVLFCSGLDFLYPNAISFLHQDLYGISLLEISKLSIVLFLLLSLYKAILTNNLRTVSIYSSLIGINYITCVPALAFFCLFWTLYRIKKSKNIKSNITDNFPFIITCLLIVIFYSLFGGDKVHGSDLSVFPEFFDWSFLKTCINIIGKAFLQIGFSLAPVIFICLYSFRKYNILSKYKRLFFSHFLLVFGGLISWALLHRTLTSIQLWNNIYIVSNLIFIVFSIVIFLSQMNLKKSSMHVIVILTTTLYVSYSLINIFKSPQLIKEAKISGNELRKENRFIYSRKKEAYKVYSNQLEQVVFGRNSALFHEIEPLNITCISPEKIITKDILHANIKSNLTLIRYFEKLKLTQPKITFEQAQIAFIETYKIDYLLLEKEAIISKNLMDLFEPENCGMANNYYIYKRRLVKGN